jgi:LPS export ABC transporter protein LptC
VIFGLQNANMIKSVSWVMLVFAVVACSDLDTSAYRRKRTQDSIATREYAEKVTIEYTDSGYLRARVFSPVLVAVKQSGSQFIEMNKGLKVDFYDPDGSIASYMTAEYGISYPDKKEIIVRRNVEILNVKGEVLNTEELRWDQRTGKIITDRFVKITTKDQIITGQGLISDQSFTDWEILEVSATLNVPHDQIPRPRSVVPGRGRY